MIKDQKEKIIYSPGFFGTFFFWLGQVMTFIGVLFFTLITAACVLSAILDLYYLAKSGENHFKNGNGSIDWYLIAGMTICAIVCPFLMRALYFVVRDMISPLTVDEFTILDKSSRRVSSPRGGYRVYSIATQKTTFDITHESYDQLEIGQKVKISYTPKQGEVRKIILLE